MYAKDLVLASAVRRDRHRPSAGRVKRRLMGPEASLFCFSWRRACVRVRADVVVLVTSVLLVSIVVLFSTTSNH
jgi:hypothetical protein